MSGQRSVAGTDNSGRDPIVLPDELRSITPGDFTVTTVPERLDGAGPADWTEAASDAHQRLPASLLRD
jgi:hypothetical protein